MRSMMRVTLGLLGLAGSATALAQTLPSTVPIPCSEPGPPAALPPAQELRRYTGIDLTREVTFDQIVAAFGPARPYGPAGEFITYSFGGGGEAQLWLWLSFEAAPPRRLTRAIVQRLDRPYCMMWEPIVLFNELEITKRRRPGQLDFSRPLNAADVAAAWGPPDSEAGSGIQYWLYRMADGRVQPLVFADGIVLGSGPRRRPAR
jgi:hypothetical protein